MKRIKQKAMILGLTAVTAAPGLMAADYDSHWAKEAIDRWQTYGIVKGYEDDTFRPNNTLTRAEFATILSRVLNLPETDSVTSFIDIMMNADKWYAEAVNKVTSAGLMYIEGINFNPNQAITREEAAYAIAKAYELASTTEEAVSFTDEMQIADWAAKSIQAMAQQGYLKGNPDGSFKPQGTLTRAELVTMLNNITSNLISTSGVYTESVTGNVLVNASGVTLRNMTIDGDLYLVQGIGSEAVTMDNVTVTGTVYLNGGTTAMSGSFKEVRLASGMPLNLTKGNIKKLVINKLGSLVTVDKEAQVEELVENKFADLAGEGTVNGTPVVSTGQVSGGGISGGAGSTGGSGGTINQTQKIEIVSAGIYINDKYVSLPVSDNVITLDVPSLSQNFNLNDEVTGLVIEADKEGAELVSKWGTMTSGKKYTFKETEKALGIIREVALKAEISPTAAINYVFGVDKLTIGSLLESFEAAKQNAEEMDIEIDNQYDFARSIKHSDGTTGSFTIEMYIQ